MIRGVCEPRFDCTRFLKSVHYVVQTHHPLTQFHVKQFQTYKNFQQITIKNILTKEFW